MSMTILITGGTGLLGMHLSRMLRDKGYRVIHLSRRENLQAEFPAYRWDVDSDFIAPEALREADHIVHLAGAAVVGKRWSKKQKRLIIDSRVNTLKLLASQLKTLDNSPQSFISTSATGYYGNTGDTVITEESPAGDKGFLAETCIKWEAAADEVAALGIRTVKLRVGIVLSVVGGALPKMLMSFKVNTGSWFGNGEHYYAWIHIDDAARMFVKAIEDTSMQGIYNVTAPHPVSNKVFIQTLNRALDKTSLLMPTPAPVIRLAMGEMADTVLHGSRVMPENMQAAGFEFQFPDLEAAVRDVVKRKI